MTEKKKRKRKPARRRLVISVDDNGTQELRGGHYRSRAGGGYRVLKSRKGLR